MNHVLLKHGKLYYNPSMLEGIKRYYMAGIINPGVFVVVVVVV